jgi:hypothetical protein
LAFLSLREFEQPVIFRALLPIAEDGVGANDAPESFRSFGVGIEIGMVRPGRLAERGSQTVGVIVRKCLEQIVERLHGSSLKYRYFPPVPPHTGTSSMDQQSNEYRRVKYRLIKALRHGTIGEWQNKD